MSFRLGYYLVLEGTLTIDQVDRACRRQQRLGDSLDTHLLALGWLDLPTLQQALLDAHASPEPKEQWLQHPMQEALESVPLALVEQFQILPIARDAHALHLLAADLGPPPEHLPLSYWLDCPIQVYPTPQLLLLEGIERLYDLPLPARFQHLREQHPSKTLFVPPTKWLNTTQPSSKTTTPEAAPPTAKATPVATPTKTSPFVSPDQLTKQPASTTKPTQSTPAQPTANPPAQSAPGTSETQSETDEAAETETATASRVGSPSATPPPASKTTSDTDLPTAEASAEVQQTPPVEETDAAEPAPVRQRRTRTRPTPNEGMPPSSKLPPPRARMTPSPASRSAAQAAPLSLPSLDRLRSAFRPQDSDADTPKASTEERSSRSQSPETTPPESKNNQTEPGKMEQGPERARPTPANREQSAKPSTENDKQRPPLRSPSPDKPTSADKQSGTPKQSVHEPANADAPPTPPPENQTPNPPIRQTQSNQPLPFPDTQPGTIAPIDEANPVESREENTPSEASLPAQAQETDSNELDLNDAIDAEDPTPKSTGISIPQASQTKDFDATHQEISPPNIDTQEAAPATPPPPPTLSAQFAAAPAITPSSPGIPLLAIDFHEAMTIPGLPAFPPLAADPSQVTLIPGAGDNGSANSNQLASRINSISPSSPAHEAPVQLEQPLRDYLSAPAHTLQEKIEALLPYGGTLVPPILEHIPVTEQFNDKNPDTQERLERLVDLCKRIGDPAVYRLLQVMEREEQPQRMRALLLLGEWLPSRAIAPLLQRLFIEKDAVIQRMIRNNLRGYRKRTEFHKLLQFLRDNLRSSDPHRLQKAIFFLGDLRIAEAVPDLIELLHHESSPVRESALFALRNLALQDHGNHTEKWKEWHDQFSHLDRKHWVVHALNHEEKAIRHLAKEELRVEFGDDFGYDPKATNAEREAVQKLAGLWLQSN